MIQGAEPIRAARRRFVASIEGTAKVLRNPITPALKAAFAAGGGLSFICFRRGAGNLTRASASGDFQLGGSRTLLQRLYALLSRSPASQCGVRHSPERLYPIHCGDLAVEHREIVERIWRNLLHRTGGPDCEQVVRAALYHLRDDLRSERGAEVLEEIGREIAFRNWCDEQMRLEANRPNDPWKIKL